MGLEGISEFLRKKHTSVIKEEHLSNFAFKKICVDISGFIYRYMSIHGKADNKWLQSFINLILLMKNNYINFIPVFDGKPPKEKKVELQTRKENRNQIKEKVETLSTDIQNYYQNFEGLTEEEKQLSINRLLEVLSKIKKDEPVQKKSSLLRQYLNTSVEVLSQSQNTGNNTAKVHIVSEGNSLLSRFVDNAIKSVNNELNDENIKKVVEYVEKQKGYFISITNEDIQKVKSLFEVFNINYIQSKSESEQTCCQLVNEGYCDAILSSDTDCIAHRVKVFIFNLDVQTGMIKYILKDELLSSLEFKDDEQLTDFGILVGCDYNKAKKIKNIGPVKAHQLIKEYKTLEIIKEKIGLDIDSIDYIRCRELFHYDLSDEEKIIERWLNPDLDYIDKYCEENNLFVNMNKIRNVFEKKPEIFYNEN